MCIVLLGYFLIEIYQHAFTCLTKPFFCHKEKILVIPCFILQNDIRKNPAFRAQFHEMCAKVGVDPLASNKGFWAELLGIGDFYYELGWYQPP